MLGFKIVMEVEGRQTSIDNVEQLRHLQQLISSYLRLASLGAAAAPTPQSTINTALELGEQAAVELARRTAAERAAAAQSNLRLVDYARRAAATFQGAEFTLKDLADRMEEMGWRSESVDKPNTIRSTIRVYPFFQSLQNGFWRYEAPRTQPGTGPRQAALPGSEERPVSPPGTVPLTETEARNGA